MKKLFFVGVVIFFSMLIFLNGKIVQKVDKPIETPVLDPCSVEKSTLSWFVTPKEKPINSSCFIDNSLLENKIKNGLPKWAKAQIEEDLSKFPVIKKKDLKRYFAENTKSDNIVVQVQIKNKAVKMTYATSSSDNNPIAYLYAGKVMQYVFEYLSNKKLYSRH